MKLGSKRKRPGSGIPARLSIRILVWLRRLSQAFFLSVFLLFLVGTAFRGTFSGAANQPVRLPWHVELFLQIDPFVAVMTLLSTHVVYRGLALSLIVIGLTLVFGRVFCGWICPFGTLNHLLGWILPSKLLRGTPRIDANRTKWWQAGKYYLLLAFLAAALVGSAWGGGFDPICFAVRGIGLGLLPALQYVGIRLGDAASGVPAHSVQAASDATQDFLARHVWTSEQAYFNAAWFILLLLVAALMMNRFFPRFWCRALCPLGALLGIFSRFSLFGMQKRDAQCTDCNLCLRHC